MSRTPARRASFDAGSQHRRSLIAKVHIGKTTLGLAEDDYRAILLDVAGRRSAADCTVAELIAVVAHFAARGFTATAKPGKPRQADHPMARKARAMWISLHQLGAVKNPSEAALEAFAARQLGCEKLQWANQALAYRLIEALKAMAERHGWSQDLAGVNGANAKLLVLKRGLVEAIRRKLIVEDLIPDDWDVSRAAFELAGISIADFYAAPIGDLDVVAAALGRKLRGDAS